MIQFIGFQDLQLLINLYNLKNQKINRINNLISLYFSSNKDIFKKEYFIMNYFKIMLKKYKYKVKEIYNIILYEIQYLFIILFFSYFQYYNWI